jgi:dTDP-4-amino-4,6-dideoxy-D-galactose acyltransferase
MTGTIVTPLAWDTEFWGVLAARVHATTSKELEQATDECRGLGVDWASLLIPLSNIELLNAAIAIGYRLADIRQTLRHSLPLSVDTLPSYELAEPRDELALCDLAERSFENSRFFADPNLDRERCRFFYNEWVRQSQHGSMGDAIVIHRSEGRTTGFVTVKLDKCGGGSLPLVAVDATERGRGVGRSLVSGALQWMAAHGAQSVDVVTQASNLPAVRLYEESGFRTLDASAWLHCWY